MRTTAAFGRPEHAVALGMRHEDAVSLIRAGVPRRGATWADLGAGGGTFTRALADILGDGGEVHAIDRDPQVMQLAEGVAPGWARVVPRQADFTRPLPYRDLDGILMANALHFVAEPARVLAQILTALRNGGTFLLVEYDLRQGNPWIPHPIPRTRFDAIAEAAGLQDVRDVGRIASRYGSRDIYAAAATKVHDLTVA